MKRLKFLVAFTLSAVMAFVFFMFGSCDIGSILGGGNNSDGDNGGAGSSTGSGITITADTDPDAIVSQVLTQEEWNNALQATIASTNFSMKSEGRFLDPDHPIDLFKAEVKIDGNNAYQKQTYVINGEEQSADGYFDSESIGIKAGFNPVFSSFKDQYHKFSYDNQKNAYVGTNITLTMFVAGPEQPPQSEQVDSVVIKLADGKVCFFAISGSSFLGNFDLMEFLFYDYGTTQVTLPEVTE